MYTAAAFLLFGLLVMFFNLAVAPAAFVTAIILFLFVILSGETPIYKR